MASRFVWISKVGGKKVALLGNCNFD